MSDNKLAGIVVVIVLAILQMVGWYFNHNGILSASIIGIIGLICGSIFGFAYGLKKGNQ